MSRVLPAALIALTSCLTPACAVDLALTSGAAVPNAAAAETRAIWTGEVRSSVQAASAVETGIWAVDHLTLGFGVQARATQGRGALYTSGGSLGLAFDDGSYQALVRFESGVPLGWSDRLRGYYVGGDAALLWPISKRAPLSEPNRVLRLLDQRTFIGPMLRYRYHDLSGRAIDQAIAQHDVVLGLQVRLMIGTDLL